MFLARLSVRTILNAVFVSLAAIVGVALVYQLATAWDRLATARRAVVLTGAEHDGFAAMIELRNQRQGMQNTIQDADDAVPRAKNVHATAEKGLAAIAAAAEAVGTQEAIGQIAKARRDWDAMATIRQDIEAYAATPKAQRSLKSMDAWYKAYTAVLDDSVDMLRMIDNETRLAEAEIGELITMRQLAWTARDYSGRECGYMRIVTQTNIPATVEQQRTMMAMRGATDVGWSMLRDVLKRPGVAPSIIAAADSAYAIDKKSRADRDATYAKLDNSGKPLFTGGEWDGICSISLAPIVKVIDATIDEMQRHAAAVEASAMQRMIITAAALLLALLATAAGVVLVHRRVSRPVQSLSQSIAHLAKRDYTVPVPATGSEDEFGRMAATLEALRQGGLEAERLTAAQMQAKEAELKRAETLERSCHEFDASIRAALEAMKTAGGRMTQTAQGMTVTAETTAKQSTAVAAASDQASANVQTVAAAAEELAASVSEISRQVSQAAKVAADAAARTERTNASVKSLAEAAQKIGEVVKLINDIAGQTNLLALNATIEAARAGEAGKGFAVVASEVKSLATQTAKATEEISAQIAGIQGSTNEAVAAIREIGTVISEVNQINTAIASAVEEQGAATQEIARNAQEAAKGTTDVSANIAGVTQSAGESGQAAAQVLDVAKQVAAQSNQLRAQVDGFLEKIRA